MADDREQIKQSVADCCDSWCKTEGMPTYSDIREALAVIVLNAEMNGLAGSGNYHDFYRVPLDDIDAAKKLLGL